MKVVLYNETFYPILVVETSTPQNSRWSHVYEIEQELVDQYHQAQKKCELLRDKIIEEVDRQETFKAHAAAFENQR